MGKQEPKREHFIQLYRQKLQNDLENMGYPGGELTEAGSNRDHFEVLIIDAGSKLSNQTGGAVKKPHKKALQR